jgi:hypothetical protein
MCGFIIDDEVAAYSTDLLHRYGYKITTMIMKYQFGYISCGLIHGPTSVTEA